MAMDDSFKCQPKEHFISLFENNPEKVYNFQMQNSEFRILIPFVSVFVENKGLWTDLLKSLQLDMAFSLLPYILSHPT